MTTTDLPQRTSAHLNDDDLFDLLAAYQYLQGQNLHMATHLSTTLNIGPTDLRVLLHLHAHDTTSPKELAVKLDHTTGSITALVDRMEKVGYLERRKHPTDRRSQTLHLTDTGNDVVQQVRNTYQDAFDGVFTGPGLQAATRTLRTLADALHTRLPN